MKSKPGTYALILQSHISAGAQIGRWGLLQVQVGYYIYVGSAFGPGGISARVLRHCRNEKSMHWHIDYLRAFTTPIYAWYSYNLNRLEHDWARAIAEMTDIVPVRGFGCSDCKCLAHLFYTANEPVFSQFVDAVHGPVESWTYKSDS